MTSYVVPNSPSEKVPPTNGYESGLKNDDSIISHVKPTPLTTEKDSSTVREEHGLYPEDKAPEKVLLVSVHPNRKYELVNPKQAHRMLVMR